MILKLLKTIKKRNKAGGVLSFILEYRQRIIIL